MTAHPPAPWRLCGPALIVPALVPVARAREHVPDGIGAVPLARGRTLGVLVAVTYEDGSTLQYNELVVACATVRSGARVGGWVSHIWVDDEQSVSGGREIWKLPKELAEFRTDRPASGAQRFSANADGATLVRIAATPPKLSLPQAGFLPMLSAGGLTLGRGTFKGGTARVRVDIPSTSPIASLEMRPGPVALSGRANLVMPAPG